MIKEAFLRSLTQNKGVSFSKINSIFHPRTDTSAPIIPALAYLSLPARNKGERRNSLSPVIIFIHFVFKQRLRVLLIYGNKKQKWKYHNLKTSHDSHLTSNVFQARSGHNPILWIDPTSQEKSKTKWANGIGKITLSQCKQQEIWRKHILT